MKINEFKLREGIASALKTSLPYWESEDKDEYMYIVRHNELGRVTECIFHLIDDILQEKPYVKEFLSAKD